MVVSKRIQIVILMGAFKDVDMYTMVNVSWDISPFFLGQSWGFPTLQTGLIPWSMKALAQSPGSKSKVGSR